VKPLLADVSFPFFFMPYAAGLFAPWLVAIALLVEFGVFYSFQRGTAKWQGVAIGVLSANLVSAVAGCLLFLTIHEPQKFLNTPLPFFSSFIPAFLLSILIEYGVYVAARPWRRFSRLFVATTVSNVASYAILGAGACLLWRIWPI
jgi:uncharacterized protein YacL